MKIFALILSIFVFMASTMAVEKGLCDLEPADAGHCFGSIPAWSYNSERKECVKFNYGGCGGNANRFKSAEECEQVCKEK